MLRHALPIWLKTLPKHPTGVDLANTFRSLQPLLWQHQIVEALVPLSQLVVSLGYRRAEGTESERAALRRCHLIADKTLGLMTHVLGCALTGEAARSFHPDRDTEKWITSQALCYLLPDGHHLTGGALTDLDKSARSVVEASLPELERVLRETSRGDSQKTVAERCAWTTSKGRRAA